ncbi:MAG: hypothetical protein KKA73_01980, partial [Chloroflexi bacterium]|nr:hypothetical protein [Chloroflexota bacterium]
MIEDFAIDTSLGQKDQIGLFIKANDETAQRFHRLLWQNGLSGLRDYMPSKRSGFTHFTYVSAPDSGLDKQGIRQRLNSLCQAHCTGSAPSTAPDYDSWRTGFDTYVRSYRAQDLPRLGEHPVDAFDKAHAYVLIQSAHYAEAEGYLRHFATDEPPALVPAYLVYLYHAWRRPDEVTAIHARYLSHLHAGDVDRRVIEWIVEAYLGSEPPSPERALSVLDDFLPEFQRQGVADRLLALRAQARALQGHLPQTVPDLRTYIVQAAMPVLIDQLENLLEVVAGLPAPVSDVAELLHELAARVEPGQQWRIALAQSALARRANNLDEALAHLRTVLDTPPPDLEPAVLNTLCLDAATLYLSLEQSQNAVEVLDRIALEELLPGEHGTYWGLLGRARVVTQPATALAPLRQAYEFGLRTPEVLQPLARLAYQAEDLGLAQRAYTDLLQTGFEPGAQDRLYAGILAWLDSDYAQAVELLAPVLDEQSLDPSISDVLAPAYEALVASRLAVGAAASEVAVALTGWTDVLMSQGDQDGLVRLAENVIEAKLDRPATFALLESIEPSLAEHHDGRQWLAQAYFSLLCAEVDASLRQGRALPTYVLDLRRGLFELDR